MSKFLKLIILYVLGFFFIYEPGLNNNIIIFSIIFGTALLLETLYCFVCYGKHYIKSVFNKMFIFFILGITLANLYFAWRAFSTGNSPRFMQNYMVILQVFSLMNICYLLNVEFNFNKVQICRFFLNIGIIQSLIAILMLIIPSFHNVALTLYYASKPENIFISGVRIYGISSDYTFFTPIFHGILAVLAFTLALEINFKYISYIPFLLLVILLNGRTGFLMFLIGCIVVGTLLSIKNINSLFKGVMVLITVAVFGIAAVYIIYEDSPNTFNWLASGFQDLINFFNGQKTGNFATLSNMWLFPTGVNAIFGMGFRLYNNLHGFPRSDIAYVNDMFMGGVIYIAILYTTVYRVILYGLSNRKGISNRINWALSISFVIILLFSNYKGEVMRSGLVLTIMLVIKYVLLFLSDEKENDNGKSISGNEYI